MDRKLRIGILGCGDIAYQCYIPVLKEHRRAEVTVVCDNLGTRAEATAELFGIPAFETSYEATLERDDVDAVVVLTQGPRHGEHTLMALRAGKHACVEKPMARSAVEATAIVETAAAMGLVVTAALAVVLRPSYAHIKRLIEGGAVGKACWVRAHSVGHGPVNYLGYTTDPRWFYQKGTGPLRDSGVYQLHTLTGLLGPMRRVSAMASIGVPELIVRVGPARDERFQVEEPDINLLSLDFGDGVLGTLDAAYVGHAAGGSPLEIFGSEGTIALDGGDVKLYRDDHRLQVRGWQTAYAMESEPKWNYAYSAIDLVGSVLDGHDPVVSAKHARHVVEIMEKALLSAETGQAQALATGF
jgi:predicted dehydrogenase